MKITSWRLAALAAAASFVAWCIFVNRSASGHYWFGDGWNFEVTGQLGDSFGVISAVSATVAAVFAYKAATDASAEAHRLRGREEARDTRDQQREKEDIFFRLLDQRFQIASQLTFIERDEIHDGLHAAERMVSELRISSKQTKKSYYQEFAYLYRRNKHELAHYFRFTYHVLKYLDGNMAEDKAYEMSVILRAHLSMPEQILIGLNALSTNGSEKMKPIIEKYAVLHSLPMSERRRWGFDKRFKPGAFERGAQ